MLSLFCQKTSSFLRKSDSVVHQRETGNRTAPSFLSNCGRDKNLDQGANIGNRQAEINLRFQRVRLDGDRVAL